MKHLCQEGPTAVAIIDPFSLPWSVYAYGPDDFAREHPIGCNTYVMATIFLKAPGR